MNPPELRALVSAVQTNCHISDARHAGDMTMCIYLLQMREFFRWEQGYGAMQSLPHDQLGAWLTQREALWESLEEQGFGPLPVGADRFEPFDVTAVNLQLRPLGLVYGAGLVGPGRASFFLADQESVQRRGNAELLTSGREHARGMWSPPAALSGSTIYLRRESLARWLWQKYEAWTVRRPTGAFRATLDSYGFEHDAAAAVDRMAQEQAETLVLHELGELEAGKLLGAAWQEMRSGVECRVTDLYLRAVRDQLADCLVTLPVLLERGLPASIHFWFSNLEGLRAELHPLLARAYTSWCAGDQGQALTAACARGRTHWAALCEEVLALYAGHGPEASAPIRRLLASPSSRL